MIGIAGFADDDTVICAQNGTEVKQKFEHCIFVS